MTGQWTDIDSYDNCNYCIGDNFAGDGKFDQDSIPPESDGSPGRLEMPLGRIDFAKLPVYADGIQFPGVYTEAQAELKLFQRYFDKVLRFRRNEIGFLREVRSWQGDGAFHGAIGGVMGLNTRLIGTEATETGPQGTDLFLANTNYIWGSHGDYGLFSAIGVNQYPEARRHPSADVVQLGETPRGIIMLLDGSYMGDWYFSDSLMRTCVGMLNTSLVTLWGRDHRWRTNRVHAGAGIYSQLADTMASGLSISSRRSILGDPTLRERYIAKVSGFSTVKSGSNVTLTWTSNSDADEGYRIYRADGTNTSSWTLLTSLSSGVTPFTTAPTNPSTNAYLVKAAGLRTSGSGSITVLSIGTVSSNEISIP